MTLERGETLFIYDTHLLTQQDRVLTQSSDTDGNEDVRGQERVANLCGEGSDDGVLAGGVGTIRLQNDHRAQASLFRADDRVKITKPDVTTAHSHHVTSRRAN